MSHPCVHSLHCLYRWTRRMRHAHTMQFIVIFCCLCSSESIIEMCRMSCDMNDVRVFCWEKPHTRHLCLLFFFCSLHSSDVFQFLLDDRKPCQIERMSAKYKPTSAIQYSVCLIQQNESAICIIQIDTRWRPSSSSPVTSMSNGFEMLQQNFILFTISASENNEKSIFNCFLMVGGSRIGHCFAAGFPSRLRLDTIYSICIHNMHSLRVVVWWWPLKIRMQQSPAHTEYKWARAQTAEDLKWLDVWPTDFFPLSLSLFTSRHTKIEMKSFNWMLCRHIYWLLNMCYSHSTEKCILAYYYQCDIIIWSSFQFPNEEYKLKNYTFNMHTAYVYRMNGESICFSFRRFVDFCQ